MVPCVSWRRKREAPDYRTALPAAAGVEMAHGFSLIHEELRLGSPTRGDRPALWWVWGHAQGINAGDGMYALAPAGGHGSGAARGPA